MKTILQGFIYRINETHMKISELIDRVKRYFLKIFLSSRLGKEKRLLRKYGQSNAEKWYFKPWLAFCFKTSYVNFPLRGSDLQLKKKFEALVRFRFVRLVKSVSLCKKQK